MILSGVSRTERGKEDGRWCQPGFDETFLIFKTEQPAIVCPGSYWKY